MSGERLDQDPRPDLTADSARWTHLLRELYHIDGERPEGAFASYHFVRCLGARLVRSASGWAVAAGEINVVEFSKLRSKHINGFQHMTAKILAKAG